jgi:uncharacterized protein YdcH (DUF465 family)
MKSNKEIARKVADSDKCYCEAAVAYEARVDKCEYCQVIEALDAKDVQIKELEKRVEELNEQIKRLCSPIYKDTSTELVLCQSRLKDAEKMRKALNEIKNLDVVGADNTGNLYFGKIGCIAQQALAEWEKGK